MRRVRGGPPSRRAFRRRPCRRGADPSRRGIPRDSKDRPRRRRARRLRDRKDRDRASPPTSLERRRRPCRETRRRCGRNTGRGQALSGSRASPTKAAIPRFPYSRNTRPLLNGGLRKGEAPQSWPTWNAPRRGRWRAHRRCRGESRRRRKVRCSSPRCGERAATPRKQRRNDPGD